MRASTKLMNKQKTSVANIKWQIRHKPQSRTAQVTGSHQNSTSSGNHSWFWRSLAQPATWSPVPSWTCEAPAAWSWLGERHIYASLASDFITHPLLWEYQIIWLSKDVALHSQWTVPPLDSMYAPQFRQPGTWSACIGRRFLSTPKRKCSINLWSVVRVNWEMTVLHKLKEVL